MSKRLLITALAGIFVLGGAAAYADTSLLVDGNAPRRDNFSMKINFDGGTGSAFVAEQDFTNNETHINVEFFVWLDSAFVIPFNGSSPAADRFNILRLKDPDLPGSQPPVRLILKGAPNGPIIQALVQDDTGAFSGSQAILLTQGAWQRIRVDWQAASAPGANDGFLELRRGNGPIKAINGLDTDTKDITRQEWGAAGGVDAGTLGQIAFDDYTSIRVTPAGW